MAYIIACFALILLDIATGIMKAVYEGQFSSRGLRQGGLRKLSELVLVFLGVGLEYAQTAWGIETPFPATSIIGAYIVIMEIVSILENVGAMNKDMLCLIASIKKVLKGGNESDGADKGR